MHLDQCISRLLPIDSVKYQPRFNHVFSVNVTLFLKLAVAIQFYLGKYNKYNSPTNFSRASNFVIFVPPTKITKDKYLCIPSKAPRNRRNCIPSERDVPRGRVRNCSISVCPPFPVGIRTFYRRTALRSPRSINSPGKLSEIEFSFHRRVRLPATIKVRIVGESALVCLYSMMKLYDFGYATRILWILT